MILKQVITYQTTVPYTVCVRLRAAASESRARWVHPHTTMQLSSMERDVEKGFNLGILFISHIVGHAGPVCGRWLVLSEPSSLTVLEIKLFLL